MWLQCIEMGDTIANRNTLRMIEAAKTGDEYSKMMLEGMAEKKHREENPEYYKHVVYNPGYSGLRDVHRNDVTNRFIDGEKTRINDELDAMRTSSSSNSQPVVGEKTPRKKTPTKEEQQLAKLEMLANQKNIEIKRLSGNNYEVSKNRTLIGTIAGIGFVIVFLMGLLFPKMKHDSQNAGASRKSKKSSRRNRK
jgi:hypothetical protein